MTPSAPRISEDELAEALRMDMEALRVTLPVIEAGSLTTTISVSMLRRMYDSIAARSAPAAGLDVAWAEAEAAVPEGYGFGVTKTVAVASGPYVATADYGPVEHGYAYGPTPAAALFALAAALTAEEVR